MEIDEKLENLKKEISNHEQRISELESLLQKNPKVAKKKISIKEFILSKKPKKEVQKTLVVGYYLEKYELLTSFNAKDLKEGFRNAKEKIPKNINYKVIKNIEEGYMMESKEKKDNFKAWTLTDSGEKFVENNFENDRRKNS